MMKKVIKTTILLIIMYNMFQLAKVETQRLILEIEQDAIERYIQEQKENESQHVAKKLTPQVVNEYVLAQEGIRI